MSDAEWPAPEPAAPRDPERRPAPLPRIEDLPIAEQGYDREKVREAFDAFYRHAAQLDATLSTLEAVEAFQRTSAELRAELRTIRGSGWTVQSWQGGGGYGTGGRVSEWSLPPAFPRVALEALFLIVMGVIVGVAGWSRLTIVLVMALALGVVWLIEWIAARERAIPQAAAVPVTVPDLDEKPAEVPAAPAPQAWAGAQEEGPEAMTMLGAPPVRAGDDAAAEEAVEPEAVEEPDEVEEPEPPAEVTEEDVLASAEPLAEADPEPAVEPEPVAVDEPDASQRFGRFRRRREEAEEPEVIAAPEAVGGEVLDGARELEEDLPETSRPLRDPWEEPAVLPGEPVADVEAEELPPEPEPAAEHETLEDAEPEPEPSLRVEQAAAALERSRARRRTLRRARRR